MSVLSRLVWLGFAVAISAAGCEALVTNDVPPFTCAGKGQDGCPAGQVCNGSECVPCSGANCVGQGGAQASSSAATTTLSSGATMHTATTTTGPMTTSTTVTVTTTGSGGAPPCPGGIGCACNADGDCNSHICGTAIALTQAFVNAAGQKCTEDCCTSADCPSGFVCYSPGTAGSYCVPATALGRPSNPGALGPGSACSSGAQCRSGSCVPGEKLGPSLCSDTCCASLDCTLPTTCTLAEGVSGHTSWVCQVSKGVGPGQFCNSNSECRSGACAFGSCRPRCCGAASAKQQGYDVCAIGLTSMGGADAALFGDYHCSPPCQPMSGNAFGGSCTKDEDCQSRACNTAAGSCSDVCCTDNDCASYNGAVCRPAQPGPSPLTTAHLICVKGP